jgi:hypothetical protein
MSWFWGTGSVLSFFGGVGLECRPLSMLSICSTTELYSQIPLAFFRTAMCSKEEPLCGDVLQTKGWHLPAPASSWMSRLTFRRLVFRLACLTFFPNAFEPAKYQQQPQMSRVPASSDFRAIKFKGRKHHNRYSLALPRHSTTWAAPPAQYSLFWCWIFLSCLSRTCFLVPSLLHYHKWKNKCQECLGEYKAAVREAWLGVLSAGMWQQAQWWQEGHIKLAVSFEFCCCPEAFSRCFVYVFCACVVPGLELGAFMVSHSASPILVKGFSR